MSIDSNKIFEIFFNKIFLTTNIYIYILERNKKIYFTREYFAAKETCDRWLNSASYTIA